MQCKASERHEILVPTLWMLVKPADYNGSHLNEGDVVRHAGTTDTERCVRSECSQTFEYSDALAPQEWLKGNAPICEIPAARQIIIRAVVIFCHCRVCHQCAEGG